jgi:hypothetical protein
MPSVPCFTIKTGERACLPEPLPYPTPVYPPPAQAFQPCVAAVRVTTCNQTHLHLVKESGKSRIEFKNEDGSTICARMTMDKGMTGKLVVAAGKKHIHLHGQKWQAWADEVTISPDGRIEMSGHVKLLCDKIGVCASVKAEKLCVQFKHGSFEKIVEQGK